jgi:hypothetical protein
MLWLILAGAAIVVCVVMAAGSGGGGGHEPPPGRHVGRFRYDPSLDDGVSDFARNGGRMYGVRYHDGERYRTDRFLDHQDISEREVQDLYRQQGYGDVETWNAD